ncbi:hypothetical protein QA641_32895 [Bradyrhizobium sp. CB1650]|nr:hypothetical protein [Bradyrhizobium sp. CB1650]WGD50358.1 hypothetical protein QA641_32895 [Bradyrhizobium sp. CB1650]
MGKSILSGVCKWGLQGMPGRVTVSGTVELIWLALAFSALWFVGLISKLR